MESATTVWNVRKLHGAVRSVTWCGVPVYLLAFAGTKLYCLVRDAPRGARNLSAVSTRSGAPAGSRTRVNVNANPTLYPLHHRLGPYWTKSKLLNKIDAVLKRCHRYWFVNSLTKSQPLLDSAMETCLERCSSLIISFIPSSHQTDLSAVMTRGAQIFT